MPSISLSSRTAKKSKRWKAAGWTLFFVMVLGCPALAAFVGWSLTHPDRELIQNRPDSLGLTYESVSFFNKKDGVEIKGWFIPAASKDQIVIFAHGYGKNRSSEEAALPTAKALKDAGIPSLLFDFRGSGESAGDLVSVGDFEQSDLLSAIDYAKSTGYQKIALVGYSMGATTSLVAGAESKDVQAIVADSPFAALRPYLEENLPIWSGLPNFPFTPLIMHEIPWLTGIDPDRVDAREAITHLIDMPVLLVHSEKDNKIPFQNAQDLLEIGGANVRLWSTPGSEHVGSYEEDPSNYLNQVVPFIREALQ